MTTLDGGNRESRRQGEDQNGSKKTVLPPLSLQAYTSFSRSFALAKSISATTTTMKSTTVPAL